MEKSHIAQMSNFTFFDNDFYGICILKSSNSHISVVICSSLNFGWCIREWIKDVGIYYLAYVDLSVVPTFTLLHNN